MAFHTSHSSSPIAANITRTGGGAGDIRVAFGPTFRNTIPADLPFETGSTKTESSKIAMQVIQRAASDIRNSLQIPDKSSFTFNPNLTWSLDNIRNTLYQATGCLYKRYPKEKEYMDITIDEGNNNVRHVNSSILPTGDSGNINRSSTAHAQSSGRCDVRLVPNNTEIVQRYDTATYNSLISDAKIYSGTPYNRDLAQNLLNLLNSKCVYQVLLNENSAAHQNGHGSHSSHSSCRKIYKKNIQNFNENAIDILNKVNIVSFNYNEKTLPTEDNSITHYGFIADNTDEKLSTQYHDRMDYTNCIGILIKANQELSQRICILEEEIKSLKK